MLHRNIFRDLVRLFTHAKSSTTCTIPPSNVLHSRMWNLVGYSSFKTQCLQSISRAHPSYLTQYTVTEVSYVLSTRGFQSLRLSCHWRERSQAKKSRSSNPHKAIIQNQSHYQPTLQSITMGSKSGSAVTSLSQEHQRLLHNFHFLCRS